MYINGSHKDSSINAGQFIPAGVRESAKDLELILEAYYKWTEEEGQFNHEAKALVDAFDYRKAPDNYLPHFKETLLRLFPNTNKAVLRHLLKFSKIFYKNRGTPESYEFLFKAVWGADVKLSYPSDNILKTSNGVWEQRILMKLDTSVLKVNLKNMTLVGTTSKSRALVSDIKSVTDTTTELILESISADFLPNETVTVYTDNLLLDKIGKTRIVATLGAYQIINPGKGYKAGSIISLVDDESSDGTNFSAEIFSVNSTSGEIVSLIITNPGQDYLYHLPTLNLTDAFLYDTKFTKNIRKTAEITLNFTANYTEPGRYIALKSALSNEFKLHDGDYYQDYSYVLETKLEKEIIYKPVMEILHPAGTKMFYKRLFNEYAENYTDYYIKGQANNGKFEFKPSTVVTYSNNFDYNAPESIYEP